MSKKNKGSNTGGIGHLYTVDSEQNWIDNTVNKLNKVLSEFVTFSCSKIVVETIEHTLCHRHEVLPNIYPNFVYMDGPCGGAPNSRGSVHGLDFSLEAGRGVAAADVLLYESTAPLDFFILVDGRWKNCRFLKRYLKGKYRHRIYSKRQFQTFEYIGEY